MKKLLQMKTMLLLCALIAGSGSAWATKQTFSYSDFTGQGTSGSGSNLTGATKGDITITGKGNGNTNYLQVYANNYLIITPNNGATISEIVLTATSPTYIRTWNASDESTVSVSNNTATWSGSSTSAITLTNSFSSQARITSIEVTYTPSAPAHKITAVSNNETYGTVSLVGSVITGSPAANCRYATPAYTVTGTATVLQEENEFTVTPYTDCTVQINFEAIPTHTASFFVNGNITSSDFGENATIEFPDVPKTINGMTFKGWYSSPYSHATTAPSYLNTSTTKMGNADVTYYAVFAKSSETTVWVLTALNEVEAGTYALVSDGNYAFNGSISSGHGQCTSSKFSFTDDGKASSAPEGTCELEFEAVTGGFTMYNETLGYLYASKAGSGGLDWHTDEKSYWKYYSSNWIYNSNSAYLRCYNNTFRTYSKNSNQDLQLAKKTTETTYSNYCTLFTSANMAGWKSFYDENNSYTVDAYTTVYKAIAKSASAVTLTTIDDIPAGTPVILKTTDENHMIELTKTDSPFGDNSGNLLSVTTAGFDLTAVGIYRLGYNNETGVGFYHDTATTNAEAGIVYINVASGAHALTIVFDEESTGIEKVENKASNKESGVVFNLAGQRVAQPSKGLYIVNGRKVIVK